MADVKNIEMEPAFVMHKGLLQNKRTAACTKTVYKSYQTGCFLSGICSKSNQLLYTIILENYFATVPTRAIYKWFLSFFEAVQSILHHKSCNWFMAVKIDKKPYGNHMIWY